MGSTDSTILRLISMLDRKIGMQLDCILHHSRLQQLESAWRSLLLLVTEANNATNVRVRILDQSLAAVARDVEHAIELEQSHLYARVYSDELDLPGGEPFGLLLGNYQIDFRQRWQSDTLEMLSKIAACAFAPFICTAAIEIARPECASLQPVDESLDCPALRRLRANNDSQFLGLVVPRIALRSPWGMQRHISGNLHYRERCLRTDDYLWGNAAFALAAALIQEFDSSGWFAEARHITWQAPQFSHAAHALMPLPLTDVVITDQHQRALAHAGIISLAHNWGSACCEFPAMPSLHIAPAYDGARLNAPIQLASRLPMILCASRIAHCIKLMMREKIGSPATTVDCERHIERWLRQYTIAGDEHDQVTLARFPLAAADVTVREDRTQPGRYWCTISLTPHHRIDGVDAQIRLTSEILRLAA